jgi:hypothetical protein
LGPKIHNLLRRLIKSEFCRAVSDSSKVVRIPLPSSFHTAIVCHLCTLFCVVRCILFPTSAGRPVLSVPSPAAIPLVSLPLSQQMAPLWGRLDCPCNHQLPSSIKPSRKWKPFPQVTESSTPVPPTDRFYRRIYRPTSSRPSYNHLKFLGF